LLKSFAARGHKILFLERDVPWYAAHRDLVDPPWCDLRFYQSVQDLARWSREIANAEAVIIGSFVPDGVEVGRFVQSTAAGPVVFYDIDTPVTLRKLAAGDHEYLSPRLIRGFDLYLSFTGGPTLGRLRDQHGARAPKPLWCSVDTTLYGPQPVEKRWDLSYLGTYSDDRQPTLERLLIAVAREAPDLSFVVGGPQYPASIDWPSNVKRLEHVAPADHARFYCASRFTLNVTRRDMIAAGYSPSVRLFEAAACGTAIISDRWDGIDTFFRPGEEILLVSTASEVLTLLRHPGTAERIGAAGRARVLAGHTSAHRAAELEQLLAQAR
jgi:spore maturation protein CgeB